MEDFYRRTKEMRRIIVAIESASKGKAALTTDRPKIDFSGIGLETENTTNAMSLVFLASSFEEFIREEIGQCADYLSERYPNLDENARIAVRGSYWTACLERLRLNNSILTRVKPKAIDVSALIKIRGLLDSVRSFVVEDSSTQLDRTIFFQHSRNFRPHVVNEIASRLGIKDLMGSAAESVKLKTYFGVSKKSDSISKLKSRMDEFFERRNEVVHSLSSVKGYAVDVIEDYIVLLELVAESIKVALVKATAVW